MEHTPTPWEREVAQDGEYTGPGDNPSGYIGDMYETNHVGWLDRETGEWIPVADFYRETDCIKALQAVNSHEALVEACKQYDRLSKALGSAFVKYLQGDESAIKSMALTCIIRFDDGGGPFLYQPVLDAALKLAGVKP